MAPRPLSGSQLALLSRNNDMNETWCVKKARPSLAIEEMIARVLEPELVIVNTSMPFLGEPRAG